MPAPQKIAVAGATGRVGAHIVDVLTERGHEVVPMARAVGVDVISGEGLADAVAGADCIVDAATGPSPDRQVATEFFTTATHNLQAAGAAAGVGRAVVLSIIGTDRFTSGYNAAKAAHERAALAGPIPVQVLRAAQFHEFVPQLVAWGTQGETAYVQRMRTQLVAARAVAEAVADLVEAPVPEGSPVSEVAGPREESLVEAATLLAARRGLPVEVVGVSDPADPDRELLESGALLPGPGAVLAGPTFEEWLDASA
jgi:uncharacterized protein YbjT (DUF2867 family)